MAAFPVNSFPPQASKVQEIVKSAGWDAAWKEQVTPWDLGSVTPSVSLLVSGTDDRNLKFIPDSAKTVLVPGCGRGYDVLAFASDGRRATGLDISDTAVAAARKAAEGHPHAASAEFVCHDFFTYEPQQPFDVIFDYTFFCALPLELRPTWAEAMNRLLSPSGLLFTLIFPIGDYEGGPPYAVSFEAYASLLQPLGFTHEDLPTTSVSPREGKEKLVKWQRSSAAKI